MAILASNDRQASGGREIKPLSWDFNYLEDCAVYSLKVHGREVLGGLWNGRAVACSAVKQGGKWRTTRNPVSSLPTFKNGKLTVNGIRDWFDGILDYPPVENWTITNLKKETVWKIEHTYLEGGAIEDTALPVLNFKSMDTWTGAILGTGGVAWCKLFDAPNATYAVHTNSALFWKKGEPYCLYVKAESSAENVALRFTRTPEGEFQMAVEAAPTQLVPRQGQYRFFRDRQDIWAPFEVRAGDKFTTTLHLEAVPYQEALGRGELKGVKQDAVEQILNTIGRIGVIDDKIMGSNGWYSGYAVLHEPWFALMGSAIADPSYTKNLERTLDDQRDHAIQKDGMVKSRWAYFPDDAKPGTYEPNGFYECQWGRLMDTQPSYVINVAELYDLNGDRRWVRGQKEACEAALDYLLRRDTDGNGLVEMECSTSAEHKASDWLDVVWASYESAFVNAQLYRALDLWSSIEDSLGDMKRASDYRDKASKLKAQFNKPLRQGGFWNEEKGWYVYWREKDGSVHGDNLTLPVNFMAIGYGVCDDEARKARVLDQVEAAMEKEKLFCWPANIYPFTLNETSNQPFPTYENGDIFLAWAELGVRCYCNYKPEIALKYVENVLRRYEKDGLAFQRYLRKDRSGAGDDILANNCSAVVGLYRNIYGIQPKPNRLYLEPHLTTALAGTRLRYRLRGQDYTIRLKPGDYRVENENWSIRCRKPFGIAFHADRVELFRGRDSKPARVLKKPRSGRLSIEFEG